MSLSHCGQVPNFRRKGALAPIPFVAIECILWL